MVITGEIQTFIVWTPKAQARS